MQKLQQNNVFIVMPNQVINKNVYGVKRWSIDII